MTTHQQDADIEWLTRPGHDRECAKAILAQARHRSGSIDDIQIMHLLNIGYRAGGASYAGEAERLRGMLDRIVVLCERVPLWSRRNRKWVGMINAAIRGEGNL